jgi:hypothetical protein
MDFLLSGQMELSAFLPHGLECKIFLGKREMVALSSTVACASVDQLTYLSSNKLALSTYCVPSLLLDLGDMALTMRRKVGISV